MANSSKQPDLSAYTNTPEAASLLKNKKAVSELLSSQDTKQLMAMLEQQSGGSLQQMAQAALKGDPSQLMALMNRVTASKEGAQVVERITRSVPKK